MKSKIETNRKVISLTLSIFCVRIADKERLLLNCFEFEPKPFDSFEVVLRWDRL